MYSVIICSNFTTRSHSQLRGGLLPVRGGEESFDVLITFIRGWRRDLEKISIILVEFEERFSERMKCFQSTPKVFLTYINSNRKKGIIPQYHHDDAQVSHQFHHPFLPVWADYM